MAEASLERMRTEINNKSLDRMRTVLLRRIFLLISYDCLKEIKQIFETLKLEHCLEIINSSINGITPLYVAVNNNNVEFSRYLVILSLLQGSRTMSEHWKKGRHPLIAAIEIDNSELIELILQHLSDINENIDGANTPLMIASSFGNLMAVKLIVAKGADINRPCFQGQSPLMESTSNSEICKFLLSRGANVNHQDDEGFTALHLAIARDNSESVVLLVSAGSDVRIQSQDGINPLIWAIINKNRPMVMYLFTQSEYSDLDQLDNLEISNSCYLCDQMSDITPWMTALKFRREEKIPKSRQIPATAILDFSEEFTTKCELKNLQGNSLLLAFQGILVVERILGRNNRLYLQLLLQTALIAKKVNNMEKVRQFIDYIEEYCQESSVLFVASNLRFFKSLFCEFGNDPNEFFEYGSFSIFKIISRAAVKMWRLIKDNVYNNPYIVDSRYSQIVETFLYMTSTIETGDFSLNYLGQFREVVKIVIREDLRFSLHHTVLNRAIELMRTQPWCSVELIEILLESGADPNCQDYFEQTSIMYAVKHVPKHIRNTVLALLSEYGGQPDGINSE